MKKLLCLFLVVLISIFFVACGSGGDTEDDSWKNKKWDEMNGEEKQKTREYIDELIEKSTEAGADWSTTR
jgi:hypothetical protein